MNGVDISRGFSSLTASDQSSWRLPEGWLQGRGAWGGLLVGTAVHAAEAADVRSGERSSPRVVREVSIDMLGPVPPGDTAVRVTPLRQGSGTSAWRVEFLGDGEVLSSTSVVLGQARSEGQPFPVDKARTPPFTAPWDEIPVTPLRPPQAPQFAENLEFRAVSGLPYQGRLEQVVCWVRFPPSGESADAAFLLGMVDAVWPATMTCLTSPRPIATLTFAASLLVDPATVDANSPLLHRGRLVSVADGYATETRELWTPDGRLAVWNTQVAAIIR